MKRTHLVLMVAALLMGGCSSGGTGGKAPSAGSDTGRSTSDPRVKSFKGQPAPALSADGRMASANAPAGLDGFKGRTVFLMFAFPR